MNPADAARAKAAANDAFRVGVVIGMVLGGLLVGLIWLMAAS